MQGTRHTTLTDAALVRLLAPWMPGPQPGAAPSLIEQLNSWLRWTDAQPLFAALQDPLAVAPRADDEDDSPEGAAADAASVRALIERGLAEQAPWREPPRPRERSRATGWSAAAAAPDTEPIELATYRHHHLTQQQRMEDRIAPLRARLRRVLQLRSPAQARLAALDAVMERVLDEPQRRLLAGVPALLDQRFAALRAEASDASAAPANANATSAWQQRFQHELDAALQAELDLRWQPIDGLLAALHAPA
jgi:hypothetical protein